MKYLILFFAFVQLAAAQSRYQNYTEGGHTLTTIFPTEPMTFTTPANELVITSILIDSLSPDYMEVRLYAYFEKLSLTDTYSLTIILSDGDTIELIPSYFDYEDVYFEYDLDRQAIHKLRSTKFDFITFHSNKDVFTCITLKNRLFYSEFLNNHLKVDW